MAELKEKQEVSGVFGGVNFGNQNDSNNEDISNNENSKIYQNIKSLEEINAGTIRNTSDNLPMKVGFWSKIKAFCSKGINLNTKIKVELTPYQQKVENEINEFLHQEITWEKVHNFLFKEITFGKNKDK